MSFALPYSLVPSGGTVRRECLDHLGEGVNAIRPPYRTPVANASAGRWVETARRELFDHLLIFRCHRLEYVLREFIEHYEQARPHQELGQRIPRLQSDGGTSNAWG